MSSMQNPMPKRLAVAAATIAVGVLVVGCGDPVETRAVESTTAAPTTSMPTSADQSVSSPPNTEPFDPGAVPVEPTPQLSQVPEEWIGLTEDEAQAKADAEGRVLRLVHPDTMLTEDFQPDRVNAHITDGKVVSVEFW